MEEKLDNDLAKELLMILSLCDDDFINNIPDNIFMKINELASLSSKEYYFEKEKSLLEQDITEDCKDMLSLLYYIICMVVIVNIKMIYLIIGVRMKKARNSLFLSCKISSKK